MLGLLAVHGDYNISSAASPPVTGGVCLATRVRYRQSCGLDNTWSALLAYLFVSRICVAGLCFCFFAFVFYFFPSFPIRSGEAFSSVMFFLSFSSFICFFGCIDGMEREACVVCDHGFEKSDLCAEIIIIIISIVYSGFLPDIIILLTQGYY